MTPESRIFSEQHLGNSSVWGKWWLISEPYGSLFMQLYLLPKEWTICKTHFRALIQSILVFPFSFIHQINIYWAPTSFRHWLTVVRRIQHCPQGFYRNGVVARKNCYCVWAQCMMGTGSGDVYLNPSRQWK